MTETDPPHLETFKEHRIIHWGQEHPCTGTIWHRAQMRGHRETSQQYFSLQTTAIEGKEIFLMTRKIPKTPKSPKEKWRETWIEVDYTHFCHIGVGDNYDILFPRRYSLTEALALEAIDEHERSEFPHELYILDWRCAPDGEIQSVLTIEEGVYYVKFVDNLDHYKLSSDLLVSRNRYRHQKTDPFLQEGGFWMHWWWYPWPNKRVKAYHPEWAEAIARFEEVEKHFPVYLPTVHRHQ